MVEPDTDFYDQDTLTQGLNEGTTVRDDIRNVVLTHESGIAEVRMLPARNARYGCVHLDQGQSALLVGKFDQRTRLLIHSFGVNVSLGSELATVQQDAINFATPALYQGYILGSPFTHEAYHTAAVYVGALAANTIVSYVQEFREG